LHEGKVEKFAKTPTATAIMLSAQRQDFLFTKGCQQAAKLLISGLDYMIQVSSHKSGDHPHHIPGGSYLPGVHNYQG